MDNIQISCDYCGKEVYKSTGHYNRSKKQGLKMYCNRTCFGMGSRDNKTKEERKEVKRLYDIEYRKKNKEKIKIRNKLYNESEKGRAMQKRNREKFKSRHLEYCRTDQYRKWKKQYDKVSRAKKNYGEYWESFVLLKDIETYIDNREVKQILNLTNKVQIRRRNYEKVKRSKSERLPMGGLK